MHFGLAQDHNINPPTEDWLEFELPKRVGVQEGTPVQPIDFTCTDDGMTWLDEVQKSVPVRWQDQVSEMISTFLEAVFSTRQDITGVVLFLLISLVAFCFTSWVMANCMFNGYEFDLVNNSTETVV